MYGRSELFLPITDYAHQSQTWNNCDGDAADLRRVLSWRNCRRSFCYEPAKDWYRQWHRGKSRYFLDPCDIKRLYRKQYQYRCFKIGYEVADLPSAWTYNENEFLSFTKSFTRILSCSFAANDARRWRKTSEAQIAFQSDMSGSIGSEYAVLDYRALQDGAILMYF